MQPYPPGYRFMPTDEELINDYLLKKVSGEQLPLDVVTEGEVYGDNAQLPGNGSVEEQYLFVKSKKKNQKGTKAYRSAGYGKWKVNDKKNKILDKRGNHIGFKRSLSLKRKLKKNLLMVEYSLTRSVIQNNSEESEEWVLCRIKQSNRSIEMSNSQEEEEEEEEEEEGDGLTSRPTASPALQGISKLVIDAKDCVRMDDIWASVVDNQAMAECPSETAGGPSNDRPDQSFDQPALDFDWEEYIMWENI